MADTEKAVRLPEPCRGRPDVAAILASICEQHAQEAEIGVIGAGVTAASVLPCRLAGYRRPAVTGRMQRGLQLHLLYGVLQADVTVPLGCCAQAQRRWCSKCTLHARATIVLSGSVAGPTWTPASTHTACRLCS